MCCSTTGRPMAGPMLHLGKRTALTSARLVLHPCLQDTASEHAAGPEQAEAPCPPSGAAAAARQAAHSASAAARQAGEAVQDSLASAARHVWTSREAAAVIAGLLLITLLAGYGAATLLRPQGSSQVKSSARLLRQEDAQCLQAVCGSQRCPCAHSLLLQALVWLCKAVVGCRTWRRAPPSLTTASMSCCTSRTQLSSSCRVCRSGEPWQAIDLLGNSPILKRNAYMWQEQDLQSTLRCRHLLVGRQEVLIVCLYADVSMRRQSLHTPCCAQEAFSISCCGAGPV